MNKDVSRSSQQCILRLTRNRLQAELHMGQMLHLTVTIKVFSIILKEPPLEPKSDPSLA